MTPKFRAWFDSEMYDKPVVYDGEFYLDWREFENGETYNGSVLMQSTGLKDKNGKEIYEGDIVRYERCFEIRVEEVIYDDKHCSFGMIDKDEKTFSFDSLISDFDVDCFEVVGNKYENPEFLEGE